MAKNYGISQYQIGELVEIKFTGNGVNKFDYVTIFDNHKKPHNKHKYTNEVVTRTGAHVFVPTKQLKHIKEESD